MLSVWLSSFFLSQSVAIFGAILAHCQKLKETGAEFEKTFLADKRLLKLAKILVVLIKRRNNKCRLTFTEGKILRKYMHSFKNHIIKLPGNFFDFLTLQNFQ